MKQKNRVFLAVTNDLVVDNRMHKVATSLTKWGWKVTLTGRKLPYSQPLTRPYATRRMRLAFNKGPLFYAEYNIRLFFLLLFTPCDLIVANDLDTLPACHIAAVIRRKPLIYDSHEYFTEVAELVNRPRVKKIWTRIEKRILPRLKQTSTVCNSIAMAYKSLYGIEMKVIRNVPFRRTKTEAMPLPTHIESLLPQKHPLILYQGALNVGRGIEHVIAAMPFVKQAVFCIAGKGDIEESLINQVNALNLSERVVFVGRIPAEELHHLTSRAAIGIVLQEDMGLSYRYVLPNRLFDFIQARIPVLVSNLPEMRHIVDKYRIGLIAESHEPMYLAQKIEEMLDMGSSRFCYADLECAADELCWENEELILHQLYKPHETW